jgi:hypothetical protein
MVASVIDANAGALTSLANAVSKTGPNAWSSFSWAPYEVLKDDLAFLPDLRSELATFFE